MEENRNQTRRNSSQQDQQQNIAGNQSGQQQNIRNRQDENPQDGSDWNNYQTRELSNQSGRSSKENERQGNL